MLQNRRVRVTSVAVLMLIAAISLVNLIARPRFHTYDVMDVIQTAGIGVCFGVAITVMLGFSRKPVSARA
jgi:presenilin-like A22 family membrane protease